MYKQDLYSIITPIKRNVLSKRNSLKNWKYGYDKESDVVVISRTGQIGEIYNIQGLKIALPNCLFNTCNLLKILASY
jgi:dTDP-D-glucose 4,6-dehydratase